MGEIEEKLGKFAKRDFAVREALIKRQNAWSRAIGR
jgi:hypothetical protein